MRKDLDHGLLHAMTAFVHVLDGGSFTAAAGHMGITKAQVSRLVTLLENRLQAKLLHRTTRRIAATDAGARYAGQCKAILDMVAQAEGEVAGTGQSAGRLRVMCMTAFGNRYVTPLVARYCAANPRVTLDYSASQDPPDLLAEGIDVSVYLAQSLPDSALVALKLGRMFSVLCAAPDYLARCGAPRHPDDLARHTCLRLVNSSVTSHWELDNGTDHVRLDPQGPLVGNAAEVVLDGALRGLGIAMLPFYSIVEDIENGRLARVLPGWRSPEIGIFALLPSGRFVDAKTRAWIDLLKHALPPALARDAAHFA
ncbi:LysR family transcriptional regulator [uncultured Massilia sp.]|uniref:LysR family transcriptional regulator n=1 Tax=uncultured Massilia sp. TaxID=169973 RepID=UPI0025EB34E9|nr:LysR family transcriptional regulator [uncultured Massilia sp.]